MSQSLGGLRAQQEATCWKDIAISGVYYLSFAVLMLQAVRDALQADINSWITTEILVSYESGFIRRGLIGHILLAFRDNGIAIDPGWLLASAGFLAWGASGYFLEKWTRILSPLGRCFFLFSPLLVFFPLLDTASFPRKDIISIGVTLLHLASLRLGGRSYLRFSFVWFWIFSPAAILAHEAFAFLALPLNIIIFFAAIGSRQIPRKKRLIFWVMIPSLAAISMAFARSGDVSMAEAICVKWTNYYPLLKCSPLPGSFRAIASGAGPYVRSIFKNVLTYRFMISFIITSFFIFFHCFWLGRFYLEPINMPSALVNHDERSANNGDDKYIGYLPCLALLFCLGISLPLCAVAVDYNRWLGVVFATSTLALLCPEFRESAVLAFRTNPALRLACKRVGVIFDSPLLLLFGGLAARGRILSVLLSSLVTVPHCCVVFLVPGRGALLTAFASMAKLSARVIGSVVAF